MPVLKSETRLKEIDTTIAATDASEYAEGDLVYDKGDGLIRHNGVSFEGIQAKFDGMFINTGIVEKLSNLGNTSMTGENYDCSNTQVFYNTGTVNWRVNLINFAIPTYSATNIVIIVNQPDSNAYWPDELTISDTSTRSTSLQTVLWAGGEAPTPTVDGTDVFCFTIYNLSGAAYYILGQMVPFKALP